MGIEDQRGLVQVLGTEGYPGQACLEQAVETERTAGDFEDRFLSQSQMIYVRLSETSKAKDEKGAHGSL